MSPVIGIDFDNTIICYDDVFQRLAVEAGLVAAEPPRRQKAIREAARNSPDGDLAWQRLQGQAYGPRIQEAGPAEGVLDFLAQCRGLGVDVHVISHKTRYAALDPSGTDLRAAARDWLDAHGFFSAATGLGPERFHCGATRQEKVDLIRSTGCTHFIDDLLETFREPGFPPGVQGILFDPGGTPGAEALRDLWLARSWREIGERIALG